MAEILEAEKELRKLELKLSELHMEIYEKYWQPPGMYPPPGHKLNKINKIEKKIKELKELIKN